MQSTISANQNMLNQAMQLLQSGKLVEGLQLFRRLEQSGLDDPRLYRVMGGTYERMHDWNKAAEYFEKSLAKSPAQADLHDALGRIYLRIGAADKALPHCLQAFNLERTLVRHCKLGLCLIAQPFPDWQEARGIFEQVLVNQPGHIDAMIGMARVCHNVAEHEKAEKILLDAIQHKPDHVGTVSELAWLYKNTAQYDKAKHYFKRLLTLDCDEEDVYENIALTDLDAGNVSDALKTLSEATKQFENSPKLFQLYASVRYEAGHTDHLSHYHNATGDKTSAEMRLSHLQQLVLSQQWALAEEMLASLPASLQQQPQTVSLKASLLSAQSQYEQVVDLLWPRCEASQNAPVPWQEQCASALLVMGNPEKALILIEQMQNQNISDQYLWALKSTAWRQLGHENYHWLCDYATLVKESELHIPTGYRNVQHFNAELKATLEELHQMQRNPLQQSLRGGTQTTGNLFVKPYPILQELEIALRDTATALLSDLPQVADHPTLDKRWDRLHFASSWSVRLKNAGFHESHIHTKGWYSSAYYVDIPDEVSEQDRQGWLHLGKPGMPLKRELNAEKWIKPESGKLVLFPSFMWHGTEAFESDHERLSVAFDLLPVPVDR